MNISVAAVTLCLMVSLAEANKLSPQAIRTVCRDAVKRKINNQKLDFQRTGLEEISQKGSLSWWHSWFKSPSTGEKIRFRCVRADNGFITIDNLD